MQEVPDELDSVATAETEVKENLMTFCCHPHTCLWVKLMCISKQVSSGTQLQHRGSVFRDKTNSTEETGESREAPCFLNLPCTLCVTGISPGNTTVLCCCQNTGLSLPPQEFGEGFWDVVVEVSGCDIFTK